MPRTSNLYPGVVVPIPTKLSSVIELSEFNFTNIQRPEIKYSNLSTEDEIAKKAKEEVVAAKPEKEVVAKEEPKEETKEPTEEELKEQEEITIIEKFLPKQLSAGEVEAAVKKIIADVGASSPADMGKVMGIVSKKLAGQADGKTISTFVKKNLI